MQKKIGFNFDKPFAIIKRKDDDDFFVFEGEVVELNKLSEIPRKKGKSKKGEVFDTLSILPFSQIKERGFEVRDDKAKILCIDIKRQTIISKEKLYSILPDEKVVLTNGVQYNYTEKEYEKIIQNVIEKEIGNGQGANFVIPRKGVAKIKNVTTNKVLSIYKNILKSESGSYWTFLFFSGNRYFVGATPERHISVRDGKVLMNPISGTFRKKGLSLKLSDFRDKLRKFLLDKKEINELFMVVDEELKMMADICEQGGMIIGPLLKEMSYLIHTEYLLSGKSNKDIIDILRRSMYAATVTGSPVENACRIIKKYEMEARRYYGSALALIGRDEKGKDTLDSPITIRTIEIDNKGDVLLRVGGTLVRDSNPSLEVEETVIKIEAMLNSINNPSVKHPDLFLSQLSTNDEIHEILQQRNQKLSKFWFFNQENEDNTITEMKGKRIIIIDNEDDFCYMMKHMLSRMGARVKIVRFHDYLFSKDDSDLTIVGPGTGNPNEMRDKKMIIVSSIVKQLLGSEKKFFAVCLGHQVLCKSLGIKVEKKKNPSQGIVEKIYLFGKQETVGFYNTFTGKYKENIQGVKIYYDKTTKEIHALKSKTFVGFQFHPESILTQNGYSLLENTLIELINQK